MKKSKSRQNWIVPLIAFAVGAECALCAVGSIGSSWDFHEQIQTSDTPEPAVSVAPYQTEEHPEQKPEQTQEPVWTQSPVPEQSITQHQIETPEPEQTADPSANIDPLAFEIFECTNKVRMQNGFGKLTYAYELQEAADTRAYECSIQFSHTRPNGTSCHSIVEDFDYYVTGENLIMLDKSIALPEVIVSEWMLSEGHRHNILLSEFTELAVGVYEKDGVVYAVQIFMG